MRMSAGRIRSINRRIARVNGIIFGASDAPRRVFVESTKVPTAGIPPHTIKVVAVPEPPSA
jgi:hypothetical protein